LSSEIESGQIDPPLLDTNNETAIIFGHCRALPRTRQFFVDGQPVAIGSRAFDLLMLLIETRHTIVSRDEITKSVWPSTFVDDSNLRVQMSAVRKALGNDGWILKTIPGRGYLFTADVTFTGGGSVVLAALPPPVHPTNSTKTNLPWGLSRLFGRNEELLELKAAVSEQRLVTLVGMGGIGKTRLAVELGRQVTDLFVDGVWMIDLAPLRASSLIANAVASILGIPILHADAAMDTIASAIGQRCMLLIFDNCEHLVEAVAEFVETILRRAPQISVVAGSQQRLGIATEQIYRLKPLELPAQGDGQIQGYGAVELFIARATESDRRFHVTPETAASVVEICRSLEGIPLALEMAAARVPLLGIDGLRTGLNERLQMLKFNSNSSDSRYRTLRAMVEWSHSLLDDDERRLFRRLAVFSGGFSLDAAVCVAGENADRWEIVDLLGQLVDKSLVVTEGGDPPRYRLLETLRHLGIEQLQASNERAVFAEGHARFYAGLLDRSEADWETTPTDSWKRTYRAEIDNIRSALIWAFEETARVAIAIAVAGPAARLFHTVNLPDEARQLVDMAERLVGEEMPPTAEAGRLFAAAGRIWRVSDRQRSLVASERAVSIYRQLGDTGGLRAALALYAGSLAMLGRNEDAENALVEAHAIPLAGERCKSQIDVVRNLAFSAMCSGRPLDARRLYSRALETSRGFQDDNWFAHILLESAEAEFALDAVETAVDRARQAIDYFQMHHPAHHILGICLMNMASYLIVQGDFSEARKIASDALSRLSKIGSFGLIFCLERWALLGALDGRHRDAAQLGGFIDSRYASTGEVRQPTEQRLHDLLRETLAANLTPIEIEAYAAEGRHWSDKDATRFTYDHLINRPVSQIES